MNKVIVIGSGFSSLSAACYLSKAGYKVTVLEKNEQLGGRASVLEEDGFTFDMGPSWYWMPDIFDKFFQDFGKATSDYYKLDRLSPAYRVYFDRADYIDIEDSPEKIISTFDNIDPGSGKRLQSFLNKAEKNYNIAMRDLVYQPGLSITELITFDTAKRVNLFIKHITQDIAKVTQHPQLRRILEFPVLFLGAKPNQTPAFYNFMNWADFGLGTWYPQGGMHQVVEAMVALGKELGVDYQCHQEVIGFEMSSDDKIISVSTPNKQYAADVVVSGADYAHTESLLHHSQANYQKSYWEKKTFAPSSLLYYVGFDKKVEQVLHHNLFFDTDFEQHATEIYDTHQFPSKPLFYANFPTKSDDSLAPDSMESAFFLIPIAVDLEDSQDIHDAYFQKILARLEANTNQKLSDHIVYKKSFGVEDFKTRYHACRGNAYGLANTLMQTSVLRPSIKNKKITNLFYTGQLTVPGPGVPPAIISGNVVSNYIINHYR